MPLEWNILSGSAETNWTRQKGELAGPIWETGMWGGSAVSLNKRARRDLVPAPMPSIRDHSIDRASSVFSQSAINVQSAPESR